MAWIEHRRAQHRVYERTADGRKAYEPFATREDAELFIAFVAHSGWDAAVASVRAPAPPPPPLPARAHLLASARGTAPGPAASLPAAALPSRMHLPPPPGLRAAGVSVGELVTWHVDGLVGVEQKTIDQYRSYVRDYVDPFFGDLDAGYVIARPHPQAQGTCTLPVTAWRAWLAERPAITRKGPHSSRTLSGKTRKNIMGLASTAYRTAMADDFQRLVDRNPFQGGARGITGQDTTERAYLTVEQARAVHAALRPGYRLLFMFLILTGLRWAEAAGLRACDVCLEPDTGRPHLLVRVGLKRPRGGGWQLGRLKSEASQRTITLSASLVGPLASAIAGKAPEDLVFTSVAGKPLHHGNFCRELARGIARARQAGASVPDFRPHNLRHTCATWLLSSGRTLFQVSKHLGHESEATTGRYYGHLLGENRDGNADALEAALGDDWHLAGFSDEAVPALDADLALPELDDAELERFADEAA